MSLLGADLGQVLWDHRQPRRGDFEVARGHSLGDVEELLGLGIDLRAVFVLCQIDGPQLDGGIFDRFPPLGGVDDPSGLELPGYRAAAAQRAPPAVENSPYIADCQSRKPLIRTSPLVRMMKSGSGHPAV